LFSCPIHENNEIVGNTIENVKKYNPNCVIILHISSAFKDFDFTIGNIENVYINPIRFRTVHSQTSHVPIHLTNFIHGVNKKLNFDYVCILHTSEMFIKHGMEDYIKNYEYSLWFNQDDQPRVDIWPPYVKSYNSKIFKDLFDPSDKRNYLGNLIEGNWWQRELFEKMYNWTEKHYNIMTLTWDFAAEEVFFNTLSHHLSKTKNFGIPYCAFHHKTHYVDNYEDINDIRENKMVTIWNNNNFVYNKIPIFSKNLYSIKRINRDTTDLIRNYINSLDN
jgi:hypothetical protein